MKRFFTNVCTVLASMLLIVSMLVLSIEMFAMNRGFFDSEYTKLDTAEYIGMSEDDLRETTDVLLGYTAGTRDTLDFQAEIGGETQEVFGTREKDHMVDVRNLYIAVRNFRTWGLVAAAVLTGAAFLISRKKAVLSLCRSFLYTSSAFLVIVIAVGLYAVIDFTSFWTSFHHVFFTNDLWILDPRTDVLIQMVPEQFFFDLVTRIIVRFVAIFAGLNIAAFAGKWLYKRSERKKSDPAEVK